MDTAWYHRRGLRFACTKCNRCCERAGDVLFQASEAAAVAERLLGPGASASVLEGTLWSAEYDGSWRIEVPEGGGCALLGPSGCSVHDIKPVQCATYPFWPEILANRHLWRYEARACEGISEDGHWYDGPRIDAILSARSRTQENG
jgi:uncharacterized protein